MRPKKIIEKTIRLDPQHSGSHLHLALIHHDRGQIKEGLDIKKRY